MAIVYTVASGGATTQTGYRAIGPFAGIFTYDQRRSFFPFDLPAAGITGGVEAAELILVCTGTTGGGCTVELMSATGASGFGATLDATHDDWASTATFSEGTLAVTSTGTYTWTVDPAHLSFSGTTFFRTKNIDEGAPATYNQNVRFATVEAVDPDIRPILRLTLFSGQVIFVNVI